MCYGGGYARGDAHILFPRGRRSYFSLRGRRLKGKGKGVLGARETRGVREEGGRDFPLRNNAASLIGNGVSSLL